MKNKDLLILLESKNSFLKLKGFKFVKTMYLNFKLIEEHLEIAKTYYNLLEKVNKFFEEKKELLSKYAKKDEKGEPIYSKQEDNLLKFEIDSEDENFKNEMLKLVDKYKEDMEAFETVMKEFSTFIEQDCDINFHKINEKDVPQDISLEQLSLIADWIKFD